jgi:putative SOS response-associated peptidase YedK
MCGRFAITATKKDLEERFSSKFELDWKPNFNAAPTQQLPIILNDDLHKITFAKWGLIPFWAKDEKIGYKMINARAETIQEKKTYKSAFEKRRCLVLASGFYEWKKTKEGKKPYYFQTKDSLFAMAGIWEKKDDKVSFSIITTKANKLTLKIHDRMPVILEKKEENLWLAHSSPALLDSYPASKMTMRPVSTNVNSVKNNNKNLLSII